MTYNIEKAKLTWSRVDQRLHYTLAKHEVMEWLKKVGQKWLLELIDRIKSGDAFDKAYNQILKAD